MTQTEAKWVERVREWRAGGRTAEQFAEGQGFKGSTLRFWASRLRTSGAAAPPKPQGDAAQVRLVRIRRTRWRTASPTEGIASATGESSSKATMVIAIGAARIEVRSGFDRALLNDVVEALGGAR